MQHQHPLDRLSEQPSFTIVEAATVTGLSRVTIRRYLDAGKFPSAFRDTSTARRPSPWRIPRSDLRSLGLSISEPEIEHQQASPAPPTDDRYSEVLIEMSTQRAVATERQRVVEMLLAINQRLLELIERFAPTSEERRDGVGAEDRRLGLPGARPSGTGPPITPTRSGSSAPGFESAEKQENETAT